MMYEYNAFEMGKYDWASGGQFEQLNEFARQGWRVCAAVGTVLILERSTEKVQAEPVQAAAPAPSVLHTDMHHLCNSVSLELLGGNERHNLATKFQNIMPRYRDPSRDEVHHILEDLLLALGEYQYALIFPEPPSVT